MITKNEHLKVDRRADMWYSFDNTFSTFPLFSKNSSICNTLTLKDKKMSHKDLVKSLESKVHKLSYIHHISHTINTMQGLDELLNYTLVQALESLESEAGSIFLWDKDAQELILKVSQGRSTEELKGLKKRLGEGITGVVAQEGKPVLVKNIDRDPRFEKSSNNTERYKTSSFLCVPLIANNKLMGVINITEKLLGKSFTDDELESLYILANHTAIAIDNMQMYRQIQCFNEELQQKVQHATAELKKLVSESLMLKKYKENILESLSTGIYVVDNEGIITLWNRGMESHYDIKREDAIGKKIADILDTVGSKSLLNSIERVIKTGTSISIEKVKHARDQNDDVRTVNYSIFPLLNEESNKPIGVVVLHEDITEKLKLEHELRISERLALIGKLASGIAHELNNPLDGTRRYINLSLDKLSEGDTQNSTLAHEYLLSAKDGINRMIRIVRSLLEFSRQTSTLQRKHIDIHKAIEDALKLVSLQHPMANITIEKEYADELPAVVDYSLQTVFTNIINNALDAMPDGGLLKIKTIKSIDTEDMVEVIITDTGCGIPEYDLDHIFDPFYTTKPCDDGTGLGLAICHEIIKRSNGHIRVLSKISEGTTFTISIPTK